MATRSACVITGATPEQVAAIADSDAIVMRANKLGTLVTGKLGELVIDYAFDLPGPVYDVMWNDETAWFAVTIFNGQRATRWHNRPVDDPGYPRAHDVLGAATPDAILAALDVPPDAIGYVSGSAP